jgi:hypothetical protein
MAIDNPSTHWFPIEVLSIPVKAVAELDDEERYTYYLLGHLFNELMALQKLLAYALPSFGQVDRELSEAEVSQVLFFFRIAAGKLWEATLALRQREVSVSLRKSFLVSMNNGAAQLKQLNKAVAKMPYLKTLRDRHSFHYPSISDWKSHIQPNSTWVDDRVYVGEASGNTFYEGSASVAQHWMFGLRDKDRPEESVEPMIAELIGLIGMFNGFVEEALGAFITTRLLPGVTVPPRVKLHACGPDFRLTHLPFWTYLPSREEETSAR